jgi:branched-chain amino acid transport system permease protein
MQIIINILITFSIVLLCANSFSIIYQVSRFFHIAHAVIFTLAAYFSFFFLQQAKLNLSIALFLAIVFAVVVGVLMEVTVYKNLRRLNSQPLSLLIASLGIYVVFQNIISLYFGDATLSIRSGIVSPGIQFLGGYITPIQVYTVFISVILFILSIVFTKFTKIGLFMNAISANPDLAVIFGVNSKKVFVYAFAIGSGLAAIAGILVALDTDMRPTMGFNLLLYGVVAMIIGGIGSHWGLLGGAILLATFQHLAAFYIGSQWMDSIAYLILILFLILKPLGFSGQKLKKVEI